MATIRNINDRWGDPISFTAPTVAEAVALMAHGLRMECGYDLGGGLHEGLDYEVVEEADDSIRLGDLGTGHIWFTSVGHPTGCNLISDESPVPNEWADLLGTIVDGRWQWDGRGVPVDERFNTVLKIVAFVPADDEPSGTLETIRTVEVTDGANRRSLEVLQKPDGTFWLWDTAADPAMDSIQQIQDKSDESVADAIRCNEFVIVDDED